jgi:hypothetical protein
MYLSSVASEMDTFPVTRVLGKKSFSEKIIKSSSKRELFQGRITTREPSDSAQRHYVWEFSSRYKWSCMTKQGSKEPWSKG